MVSGIVCLAIGVPLTVYGWFTGNWARTSETWPSTEGTVIETQYTDGIAYEYEVDGEKYVSTRYTYGFTNVDDAELRRWHPIGNTVKVFYDPTNPARAILRPIGDLLSAYGITAFGAAWCLIGVWCFFRSTNASP